MDGTCRPMALQCGVIAVLALSVVNPLLAQTSTAAGRDLTRRTTYESPRIAGLAKELELGNADALARFWRAVDGKAPIVEPSTDDDRYCLVTFIWRGSTTTRKVGVLGDLPYKDQSKWYMDRLRDSDLWFKTERMPKDARFGYLLNENDTGYREDPLNPRVWGGRSVAELPDAPDEPWIRPIAGVPEGKVIQETTRSSTLAEDREFSVYLPAHYDPVKNGYYLLIVFDGESYNRGSAIPTPTILDNLLYKLKVPPTVAVLVNSQKTRDRDLLCSASFEKFVTTELVPLVRQKYRTTHDPTRTIVAGSSYGGLAAACLALRHADVVGNVLSQSGSFRYDPNGSAGEDAEYYERSGWLTRQFVMAPRLPLRFFLQVGRFEGLSPATRHLRDVLEAKGYQVAFAEYSGNHDALSWRDSLAEGLIALIGDQRFEQPVAP